MAAPDTLREAPDQLALGSALVLLLALGAKRHPTAAAVMSER